MMAEESDLERTEAPSQRRLEKAREEGNVPRSREVNTFALLTAAGIALWASAEGVRNELAGVLRGGLAIPRAALSDPGAMLERLHALSFDALMAVAPVLAVLFIVALAAPLALSGWLVSWKAIEPDFGRLSPLRGLGNIFSVSSGIELAKAIGKVLLIGAITTAVVLGQMPETMALAGETLNSGVVHGGRILGLCFLAAGGSLALIAAIDVPFQIWHYRSKLKMSREELRQEAKETEGDPQVKAAMRAQQREMARRRMMAAVPEADVVVVNPTRYAVALRYDEARMGAPRVVAKGMHLVAARIRELAETHRVPVLEAPPLARALYRHAELGDEVPAALYSAVAEVLAWVFQLRRHVAEGAVAPRRPQSIEVPSGMDPEAPRSPA